MLSIYKDAVVIGQLCSLNVFNPMNIDDCIENYTVKAVKWLCKYDYLLVHMALLLVQSAQELRLVSQIFLVLLSVGTVLRFQPFYLISYTLYIPH